MIIDEEDGDEEADDDAPDPNGPDADLLDEEAADVEPCPHCRKAVHEQAEWCHHCGKYISREEAPSRAPLWIFLTAAVALLAWFLTRVI